MSTKIKSVSVIAARLLLGLIFLVFGLNFFLQFLPTPPPSDNPAAQGFLSGLFQSGYFFPLLKGLEVVLGALLTVGLFVPLVLVILMPLSLNILLFHAFLSPESVVMSVAIMVFHLYLAWSYRGYYKSLFSVRNPLVS